MQNLGTLNEGLKIIVGSPWIAIVALFIVVIIVKALTDNKIVELCSWLGIIVFAIVIIALQGENLPSYLQLAKALYVVPVASAFSLIDKFFGFHFAVFGNTGAGKSNTVARVLQNIFEKSNYSAKGAKFVIIDSNGEYNKAFSKSILQM